MTVDAEVLEGQRVQVRTPGCIASFGTTLASFLQRRKLRYDVHIAVFTRQLKLTLVVWPNFEAAFVT